MTERILCQLFFRHQYVTQTSLLHSDACWLRYPKNKKRHFMPLYIVLLWHCKQNICTV